MSTAHDVDTFTTPRFLQEETSITTNLTDTEIVKQTCRVYGSIFLALFVIFLIVRPRYPKVYNIKKSYPSLHSSIADDGFGAISWIWKVFSISYEELVEHCGMDSMTTIRLLEFGVKLSLVGVFNSMYLFPIYALMGSHDSDPIKGISLGNLGQGSSGAYATTFSAYIMFGAAMYFISKDLEWFTSHRHAFLSKKSVQNYSVYVSGLPPEMQTKAAIRDYFGKCFSHDAVADVHVALKIPNLEKKVAKRAALIPKLEHAINVQDIKGETSTHKTKLCGGEKVDSVPTYTKDLEGLNEEISKDIDRIEMIQRERESGDDIEASIEGDRDDASGTEVRYFEKTTTSLSNSVKYGQAKFKSVIFGTGEDGAPRNAAFVSFADLTSANLARQAVHNHEPWACVPVEPPLPKLVNWKNVGKSNKSKQIGELVSFLLTATLCIFWTIPVSFVASLSNVEALTELLPFLKGPVENYAWFSSLLALLAPLILVVFIGLLPTILLVFLKFEGLIEVETMQHPSLFSKLATFTILQTFFISTIASTLFSSLQEIANNPASAITLVAEALPAQAGYFIQIILVQNLLGLATELLRISPVATNLARKIVAKVMVHNLTEKEQNETFLGLRALDDPLEYYFGRELGSKTVLLLMVLYVYGCMSPITCWFTLLIFGLLAIGFRNQFIFIYPVANDSGGKLWINFTRLSIICMIVSEIVLFAVLLLKEAFAAGILLVPLIFASILFDIYLKRRHYSVTHYLPLGDCAESASSEGTDFNNWLKDAYLQPALKDKSLFPENYRSNAMYYENIADPVVDKGFVLDE